MSDNYEEPEYTRLKAWKDAIVKREHDKIYLAAYRAGLAKAVDICDRQKEVATWSDQTDYYRGRHDGASDCATDIQDLLAHEIVFQSEPLRDDAPSG